MRDIIKQCSNCWYYAGDNLCKLNSEKSENADDFVQEIAPDIVACPSHAYTRPLAVRSYIANGYMVPGEPWYHEEEYPGWYPKIKELENQICELLLDHPRAHFIPYQLKEKFGSFILFFTASDDIGDQVESLVNDLYEWSQTHCFYCGAPATLVSRGWVQYYCNKCAQEHFEGKKSPT